MNKDFNLTKEEILKHKEQTIAKLKEIQQKPISSWDMLEFRFLWHPKSENIFSGYGIATENSNELQGLLMVDRPSPVDPIWLEEVKDTFGEYQLLSMTNSGDRGIACKMVIDPDSVQYLRYFEIGINEILIKICKGLDPKPRFWLKWNDNLRFWVSEILPY